MKRPGRVVCGILSDGLLVCSEANSYLFAQKNLQYKFKCCSGDQEFNDHFFLSFFFINNLYLNLCN